MAGIEVEAVEEAVEAEQGGAHSLREVRNSTVHGSSTGEPSLPPNLPCRHT